MIIDVDIDKFSGGFKVQFPVNQFKVETDAKMAIAIIEAFANAMGLDPELESEDIQDIIDKVEELSKDKFTVEISEEEIEVDI
jgi:quinol monooxygenase YgiN